MIPKFEFTRLPFEVPSWWPFVSRKRAQQFVNAEYLAAMRDGKAMVHRWAVEANSNVFNHPRPELAARAAFQEAEHQFAPSPTQL